MTDLTDDILHHLRRKKAVILQGPPGTGKTYHARRVVERLIANSTSKDVDNVDPNPYRWHEIAPDERHPHFSIESEEGESTDDFDIPDAHEGLSELPVVWELVQLHSGYAYEDLVRGMGAEGAGNEGQSFAENGSDEERNAGSSTDGDNLYDGGTNEAVLESNDQAEGGEDDEIESDGNSLDVQFEPRDRVVPQLARVAHALQKEDDEKPVVLVLDEINRCSLAEVLGELILLIEADKRSGVDDEGWPVRLKYPPPDEAESLEEGAYDGHTLTLPDNLWIVGTMNTADRSIAMVDYAIRRRFRFVDVMPDEDAIRSYYGDKNERKRGEQAKRAFDFFEDELSLDQRFRPGHSYFMEETPDSNGVGAREDEGPNERWKRAIAGNVVHQIAPLLEEYHREAKLPASEPLTFDCGEDGENTVTLDIPSSTWRDEDDSRIEAHDAIDRLRDWNQMEDKMSFYRVNCTHWAHNSSNIWSRNASNWLKHGFIAGGGEPAGEIKEIGEDSDIVIAYAQKKSRFFGIGTPSGNATRRGGFLQNNTNDRSDLEDFEWYEDIKDRQESEEELYVPVRWLGDVGKQSEDITRRLTEGYWPGEAPRDGYNWNKLFCIDEEVQSKLAGVRNSSNFGDASLNCRGTTSKLDPESTLKWRFLLYYIVRHFEDVDESFDRTDLPDKYEEGWVNRVEDRLNFVEFVGEELPERLAGTDSLEGGGLEPETNDAFDYNTGSHDGSWQKREPQTSRQDDNKVIYKQDGLEVTVEHDGSNWQITFEDMENGNKTDPYPLDGDEWEGFMEDDE